MLTANVEIFTTLIEEISELDSNDLDFSRPDVLKLVTMMSRFPYLFAQISKEITPSQFGRALVLYFMYITKDVRDTDLYNGLICEFIRFYLEPHFSDYDPAIVKLCQWHLERDKL